MEEIKDYFLMERKLVRSLKPLELLLYIEFCSRARWNGNKINELGVDLPKGGFIFSYRNLAKKYETTLKKVRTAVQNLIKFEHIFDLKKRAHFGHREGTERAHPTSEFCLCRLNVILPQRAHPGHTLGTEVAPNIPIPEPEPKKRESKLRAAPSSSRPLLDSFLDELKIQTKVGFRAGSAKTISDFDACMAEFSPTEDELREVVRVKSRQWKDDPKTRAWLRPMTLLRLSKFENYLAEARAELEKQKGLRELFGV